MTGTLTTPTVGQNNSSEDPKTATAVTTLNGLLTSSNLLDGAQLGAGTVPNAALTDTSITSAKLAGSITDAKLASPNNSVYKMLLSGGGNLGGFVVGTYNPTTDGVFRVVTNATTSPPPVVFDYASGDFTVGSLTTKFRVKMEVAVGSTSPSTVSLTAGLYPLTISAGNYAIGAAVAGSTAASSGLTTNTISRFNSGDFAASALLTDPGVYVLAIAVASITVPTGIAAHVQLQTRNV